MVIFIQRVSPGSQLEHGVFTQTITVVGILVTTGHLQNALNQQVLHGMINIGRVALIIDGLG